jgi:hypothetical protein
VNNFCNYNFLRFSSDFDLLQRLQVKADLTKLALLEFDQYSILDKEFTVVMYKV